MYFPDRLEYCVEIEIPAFSLDESESEIEFLVRGGDYNSALVYTAISQDIFIVFTVDYWNPEFGMYHQPFVNYCGSIKRYSVPAARIFSVTSVALMFHQKREFAYIPVFIEKRFTPSDTGIEIQVVHWQGILKYIPECLLGIHKE